jgi:hypothetical protein
VTCTAYRERTPLTVVVTEGQLSIGGSW